MEVWQSEIANRQRSVFIEIALAIGKHRGTVQKWLSIYQEQGLEARFALAIITES
jgi:transposase